jgi:hypothetical protein
MRTIALLLVGAAASCSSVSVTTRTAPNANLAHYRTFAWFHPPGSQTTPESITDQQIRQSLVDSLSTRGINYSAEKPDFLVSYFVVNQQRIQTSPAYYGWGWGWTGYTDVYTYTEGTIVVDFIDPASNRAFWRGSASQVVDNPVNVSPAKINKAVAKMINRYPTTM